MKKLTIEDIIAKKDQIQDDKKKTIKIHVNSLGGYVTLEKPDRKLIADSLQKETGLDSNIHVVYNTMIEPDLKDKEAQKAFGVLTPKELLTAILSDGEVSVIAEKLMEVAGYSQNAIRVITDEVKN